PGESSPCCFLPGGEPLVRQHSLAPFEKLFFRDVDETSQPVFAGQCMNAIEKSLQPGKVSLSFNFQQPRSSPCARISPAQRNSGSLLRRVFRVPKRDAGLTDEPLVLASRHENLESNRAARGNFLIGERPVHHQRVAEQQATSWSQDAPAFAYQAWSIRNVAKSVVGIGRVEGLIGEGKPRAGVVFDEARAVRKLLYFGRMLRGADAVRVEVNPRYTATDRPAEMQRAAACTAADFEHAARRMDSQQARYLRELFQACPTRLAQILPVSLAANLGIDFHF